MSSQTAIEEDELNGKWQAHLEPEHRGVCGRMATNSATSEVTDGAALQEIPANRVVAHMGFEPMLPP